MKNIFFLKIKNKHKKSDDEVKPQLSRSTRLGNKLIYKFILDWTQYDIKYNN